MTLLVVPACSGDGGDGDGDGDAADVTETTTATDRELADMEELLLPLETVEDALGVTGVSDLPAEPTVLELDALPAPCPAAGQPDAERIIFYRANRGEPPVFVDSLVFRYNDEATAAEAFDTITAGFDDCERVRLRTPVNYARESVTEDVGADQSVVLVAVSESAFANQPGGSRACWISARLGASIATVAAVGSDDTVAPDECQALGRGLTESLPG